MFGMEKTAQRPLLEFDLEKDLRGDHSKAKKTLHHVEEVIQELKGILRQGTGSKEFDNCGLLLHGYAALQKVIKRIEHKK